VRAEIIQSVGEGNSDILWHNAGGNVAAWLMNGVEIPQAARLG
jgi:hypothetical protein